MSRSRRKTPIIGMAGSRKNSEKDDKRRFNRKMRRVNKVRLTKAPDSENLVLKHKDEIEDVYSFRKDGKQYIGKKANTDDPHWKKEMRK